MCLPTSIVGRAGLAQLLIGARLLVLVAHEGRLIAAPTYGSSPCDLVQLLRPVLPGETQLPATHPCFDAGPVPEPPPEACCDQLEVLLPWLPRSPELPVTHPCFE